MAEQNILSVLEITALAALGTLLGAVIAQQMIARREKLSKNALNFIVAMGGGLLIASIGIVLVPEGLKAIPFWIANLMFLLGSLVFMLLDLWIEKKGGRASQLLANTMDSLPESVGIGAAFAVGGTVGPLLALLVGLQNIAEGFNSYNELQSSRISTTKNLGMQFISALTGPIGGVFGFVFLAGHPGVISAVFMFSAGGILYLVFHDIAPLAHREGHWVSTLGVTLGFMLAMLAQALVA